MQQNSTPTTPKAAALCAREDGARPAIGLLRDQRGLSTAEYTMVFVTVAIGALAMWKALGNSMANQVSTSTNTFNSVLLQHAGDANNDKGGGRANAIGVGVLKQPGGHVGVGSVGGGAVGKTDDRHVEAPAATGAHKDDQRAAQVGSSPGQVSKDDQRGGQVQGAQTSTDVHKGDQRADQMQAAQAAAPEVRKDDQQHADPMPSPSEGLHKQDQDLMEPSNNEPVTKDFQEKRDAEPHYSTNKQNQTKMDPAATAKGDSRAASNSTNKPRSAQPVKGGNR